MSMLLKTICFPLKYFWKATATRHYPFGEPFYITNAVAIDSVTILAGHFRIKLHNVIIKPGNCDDEAKQYLNQILKWRKLYITPRSILVDCEYSANIFCGRGDIGTNMVKAGYLERASSIKIEVK